MESNLELLAVSLGLNDENVAIKSEKSTIFMSTPIRYTGFILFGTNIKAQ